MRILTCFPGRFGDLLWALPTVRAISETYGVPVDLQIAGEFAGLAPLLTLQPYISSVIPDDRWSLSQPTPRPKLAGEEDSYDRVHDLYWHGGWPTLPLPVEVFQRSLIEKEWVPPLDLGRPWITVPLPNWKWTLNLTFGFSDCWFELKHGLVELLLRGPYSNQDGDEIERGGTLPRAHADFRSLGLFPAGSRWETEAGYGPTEWLEAAKRIAFGQVFLGDCSALHVLAVALGKPCVIYEPMAARLNPIFWPCGKDGPQVTLVRGLDGEATTDSRHTAETLERVLAGVSHA